MSMQEEAAVQESLTPTSSTAAVRGDGWEGRKRGLEEGVLGGGGRGGGKEVVGEGDEGQWHELLCDKTLMLVAVDDAGGAVGIGVAKAFSSHGVGGSQSQGTPQSTPLLMGAADVSFLPHVQVATLLSASSALASSIQVINVYMYIHIYTFTYVCVNVCVCVCVHVRAWACVCVRECECARVYGLLV